jgi:sugar phosphate isomerase/epimerase
MQLCFDATRFGFGLEEAVELAAQKQLPSLAYTFQAFSANSKDCRRLAGGERSYLDGVRQLLSEKQVEIACLQLDFCLDVEVKKAVSHFQAMVAKLAQVAAVLGAPRVCFSLESGWGDQWQSKVEAALAPAIEVASNSGVRLLLRTGTPPAYHGRSLSRWAPIAPQSWRDILSVCPGLLLSFSPADCVWQGLDYLRMLPQLMTAVDHIEGNDVEVNRELISDSGLFGPLWWRYRIAGKGQLDWQQLVEALKLYDYKGSLSIHLDDEFVSSCPSELCQSLDYGIGLLTPLARG